MIVCPDFFSFLLTIYFFKKIGLFRLAGSGTARWGRGRLLGWVLKRGGEGSGRRALFCGMEAEEKDKDSKVGKVKKKKDPIPPPKKEGWGA